MFSISLEQPQQIGIKVFTVTGQEIMNTDEGLIEAGTHGIVIDASSWKPGLYIYQLMAGSRIFSGKLAIK